MNEPNTMPTEQWVSASNAAISAIRTAGANNLILVPGNAWTGAHSWSDSWYGTPNATVMRGVVDPGHHFAFELHRAQAGVNERALRRVASAGFSAHCSCRYGKI